MSTLSPGRFAHPEFLVQIRADLLLQWLWPAHEYLARRGLNLPAPPQAGDTAAGLRERDLEQLAHIFLDPSPDMPPELLDSLFLLHRMATPSGMDCLLATAEERGIVLETGPEPAPADVALVAWNHHRQLLEEVHTNHEISRPRAFQYFSTHADPVPEFAGPTADQLRELHERLNSFYQACRRGPGTRVFSCRRDQQWCFLVRHGAPCRREGALEPCGRPTTVFYRPQKHDVLSYDSARGEMAVHCCGLRERRVLLRAFGKCLFGDTDFFPGTAKYTLAPLVRHGRACLACTDVPAMEQVTLKQVEFFFRKDPWKRVTQAAPDIFHLVETCQLEWPEKIQEITRATFEVKLWRARRPRLLTIIPCNQARFGSEEDIDTLQEWLQRREFINDTPQN
jgi:hypothetical protein